ncbi:MAG: NUDIX domain-containing protein [Treponema sp.]
MLWFVFFKSDMLIRKCHDGTYTVPRCDDPPIAVKHSTEIHQITPMEDGEEVRTFRVDAPITYLDDHEMCGLRASFYKLPKEMYLKAGHCHQLLFWDYTTQFCGICGGRMKKESYISKRCTVCGNEIWPSPAIAVITLIRNGDKALLVHANNFRKNFYGLVAGFVELGETLENAARREICEEVGLTVGISSSSKGFSVLIFRIISKACETCKACKRDKIFFHVARVTGSTPLYALKILKREVQSESNGIVLTIVIKSLRFSFIYSAFTFSKCGGLLKSPSCIVLSNFLSRK